MDTKGPKLKISTFEPYGEWFDLGKRWDKWGERFSRELKYNGGDVKSNADMAQIALLIYAGHEVEDIHGSLPDPPKPEGTAAADWTSYMQSLTRLNLYLFLKNRTTLQYLN